MCDDGKDDDGDNDDDKPSLKFPWKHVRARYLKYRHSFVRK